MGVGSRSKNEGMRISVSNGCFRGIKDADLLNDFNRLSTYAMLGMATEDRLITSTSTKQAPVLSGEHRFIMETTQMNRPGTHRGASCAPVIRACSKT